MPPKRRRRFQGLYYHSSPPKVLPMNGQTANTIGRRRRDPDDLSVKLSTIRIWMHEKDIGKLTRVLWAGQGNRLRQQASTNPKVKRFLTAVPYVMNSIKDVHQAVIDNSLENLQANLEPPVPPSLVTCRDANGLNLIHKAAGLGHATILEYLITTWPDGVNETDITGKTPLHWAASAKNNMRCYTLLTQAGCDEEAVDYKMKTPSFYRHKPHETERAFLTYVPEAPRVSPDIATDWEALSDDSGDGKKLDIKIPEMNGFGRHSNAESNENASEADITEPVQEDEDMSKDEETAEQNTDAPADSDHDKEEATEEDPEITEDNKEIEGEQEDDPEDAKKDSEDQENEAQDELETKEDEGPQDEKQQTETLNENIENLTKDSASDNQNESNTGEDHKESNALKLDNETKNVNGDGEEHVNDKKNEQIEQESEETINEKSSKTIQVSNGKQSSEEQINGGNDINEEKTLDDKTDEQVSEGNGKIIDNEKVNDNDENSKATLLKEKETDNENDNETNGKESASAKEKSEGEIQGTQEINNCNKENIGEENAEVEEISKEEEDSKTIGETLTDIKDDVKDSVNYLANKIKNVFSDKDNEEQNEIDFEKANSEEANNKNENEKNNNKTEQKMEVSKEEVTVDAEKQIYSEKSLDNKESEERKDLSEKETKEEDLHNKETDIINEEHMNNNDINKENTQGPSSPDTDVKENAQFKSQTLTATLKTPEENTNNLSENNKTQKQISPSKTLAEESPKKENDKTEEDKNNNSSSKISHKMVTATLTDKMDTTTNANTLDGITDEQLKELNESLEEYTKSEQNEVEEKYIGDKLEELSQSLKENVKEMADKVINVFSSTKEEPDKVENESNDVVVHADNLEKPASGKTVANNGESSDDTGDEDEEQQEQQVEVEYEENNDETEEIEASNEVEEPEPEPEQELEPAPEIEPVAETESVSETNDDEADKKQISVTEENLDDEERDGEGSPTSSLAIEGFVQGDAEDNTVQSQTAAYVHENEETRIQSAIASGDMEQLAQIVLNGNGQKLLNVEVDEPEIQAFLKNVPNYMNKIRRVHEAARNGSLLNLQQALDRRKFAIAKDEISPNGATPLHVAVLFGNSDIVRYMSARFPETTTVTDSDGRSALHYAAVINDNGHFYNVLLQLGANPQMVDKFGNTPEDYLEKEDLKDTLSYGQLLKRFGAEELQEELLSDQGQIEHQSSQENPIFKTEQGKYLADNLADPLIKALTQVAQKRPNDPLQYLANYLQTYVSSRNTNGKNITQAAIHSGSSQTSSTALATSKPPTPPATATQMQRQTSRMNGHARPDNADNIEVQQIEEVDEEDNDSEAEISKKLEERDEHGQSMLHFACARSHRKGGLIHLIEDSKTDITYRDELYRTARDVALQANQLANAKEIDRYLMSLAIVGDIKPFEHFAISGYDHIIDVLDDNETPIIDVLEARELHELASYLRKIRPLEELREELHQMIRDNIVNRVKEISDGPDGKWLIKAKNYYGRTALHIAILKESIEIVEHFVNLCPEALKIGDNLERTPLHYAMGTNIIESISRILIQNGAKRTYKDLKGRQPSYYFMNKADILRLQEEEDESR